MLVRLISILVVVLALAGVTPSQGSGDLNRPETRPVTGESLCAPAFDRPWTAALVRAGIPVPDVLSDPDNRDRQCGQSAWTVDGEVTIAQSCRWDYCCGEWGCWLSCDCW